MALENIVSYLASDLMCYAEVTGYWNPVVGEYTYTAYFPCFLGVPMVIGYTAEEAMAELENALFCHLLDRLGNAVKCHAIKEV